jgi:glycosyltransferase involved in cell wall biosynthesis
MKISFVIPAHNEEAILGQCLESIFHEIKKAKYNAEVIVVDNASTDKTSEVARSFPDVRLVHEPRKGISKARQAGYLASNGGLIANIDADTMLTAGWINKVLEEFTKNDELVALSGPFIYYDVSVFMQTLTRAFYYASFAVYILNSRVFRVSSILQGGNYVIRKSALDQLGGYDPKYDFWGEDADMARRLHPLGQVKFTFHLPIYSSGRRIANEGIVRTGWRYTINYFGGVFLKKPLTKSYSHIPISQKKHDG